MRFLFVDYLCLHFRMLRKEPEDPEENRWGQQEVKSLVFLWFVLGICFIFSQLPSRILSAFVSKMVVCKSRHFGFELPAEPENKIVC